MESVIYAVLVQAGAIFQLIDFQRKNSLPQLLEMNLSIDQTKQKDRPEMSNEGRDNPMSDTARQVLFELIRPELDSIKKAIGQIESKVGTKEGWERSTAITYTLAYVARAFSNLLCTVFGWAEHDVEKKRAVFHSTSCASREFFEYDNDQFLANMLEEVTKLMNTERYELVQKVREDRISGSKESSS